MGSGLTPLEVALLSTLAATFVAAVAGTIRWGVRRHIHRIDAMEQRLPLFVTQSDMELKISNIMEELSALRSEGTLGDKTILQEIGNFRGEQNREIGALRQEIGAAHRRMDNLFRAPGLHGS